MTPMGADPSEEESYPEWFIVIQAAKYLGVAPWELQDKPVWWTEWAIQGLSAENHAEKVAHDRAKAQAKRKK